MNATFLIPSYNRDLVGNFIWAVNWTDEVGRKLITTYDQNAKGLEFKTTLANTA
jgi:hypothetical protein